MTKPQRKKRFERQPSAPNFRLTPRDKAVIEAVYRYRVLSQTHIERLLFTGIHSSIPQQRLRLLYDHAYLQRRFMPSVGGIVTSPVLYMLDKKGAAYLHGQGYEAVRWKPDDNTTGFNHIEHLLDINTLRVEIELACRWQEGYTLVEWIDDTALGKEPPRVDVPGVGRRIAVIPDGYFAIHLPDGKTTHFFLELDRSTMPIKRFKSKVAAYFALYRSGLAQERFGTSKFRVLTVTHSHERGENLKQATESLGGENRFWFGVLSDLTAENVLTQLVWQVASRTGLSVLLKSETE